MVQRETSFTTLFCCKEPHDILFVSTLASGSAAQRQSFWIAGCGCVGRVNSNVLVICNSLNPRSERLEVGRDKFGCDVDILNIGFYFLRIKGDTGSHPRKFWTISMFTYCLYIVKLNLKLPFFHACLIFLAALYSATWRKGLVHPIVNPPHFPWRFQGHQGPRRPFGTGWMVSFLEGVGMVACQTSLWFQTRLCLALRRGIDPMWMWPIFFIIFSNGLKLPTISIGGGLVDPCLSFSNYIWASVAHGCRWDAFHYCSKGPSRSLPKSDSGCWKKGSW